jgi:hypothetical protein
MNISKYEDLNVTTMTMVMALSSPVNIEACFHLLEITRIEMGKTKGSGKCKLPHCSTPGAILSMRYGKKKTTQVRGIIRTKAKPFKNAVTIDISTTKKNISLKLSSFSIQMCGASSRADGIEAATHLVNKITRLQYILDKMKLYPQKTLDAIQWVKDETRGKMVTKPQWPHFEFSNVKLRVYKPIQVPSIIACPSNIPKHIDEEIAKFLMTMCDDFMYHDDMCQKLDFIPNIQTIIEEPLLIRNVDEAMVNYNYKLGFKVNRSALDNLIHDKNGFHSRYNNALVAHVTIELPYTPPSGMSIKRRKGKIPHHTFLVYRSGSVTQSGPGGELMREAYYLFMKTLVELLPEIVYDPDNGPLPVVTGIENIEMAEDELEDLDGTFEEREEREHFDYADIEYSYGENVDSEVNDDPFIDQISECDSKICSPITDDMAGLYVDPYEYDDF